MLACKHVAQKSASGALSEPACKWMSIVFFLLGEYCPTQGNLQLRLVDQLARNY